jgi:hypothetical protein
LPTVTIQVASVTAPDQWTLGAGANKVVAVNSPSDDATSYIYVAASTKYEQYSLAASMIPGGSTINSVSVFSRCMRGGATNSLWRVGLVLGANFSESDSHTAPSAWVEYTDVLARPGGGAWSTADLASLEVYVRSGATANQLDCTSLWLIVDYTPPAPPTDTGRMLLMFP